MLAKDTGIILKKLSAEGHTFVVLCLALGKIHLVVLNKHQKKQLRSGSLITFTARTLSNTLHASDTIELQAGLLTKHAPELYWLHLLFEVCSHFVPLHQPVSDIFNFVYNCTQLHHQLLLEVEWNQFHKTTIGCLFLLLGFAPPPHLIHTLTTVKKTVLLFIDFTNEQKVKLSKHYLLVFNKIPLADLDRWVLQCIQSHPSMQSFKTIHFVYPPQA